MYTEDSMEISKKCPKCNKDYAKDPYWKSSLKKHLARKNPCDGKQKYIREPKKIHIQIENKVDDFITRDAWRLLSC